MKRVVLVLAVVIAGCSNLAVASGPAATNRPSAAGPASTERLTSPPSAAPVTDNLYRAGDTVTILEGEEPWAEVTVDKVKQRSKYAGEYYDDEPAAGNVYVEMFVAYHALAENVSYASYDWDLYIDDIASDDSTFVLNGPEPDLGSGQLPKGRKAQGWLVYEIPKLGRVVLSYKGNVFSDEPPIFEIVLRNK